MQYQTPLTDQGIIQFEDETTEKNKGEVTHPQAHKGTATGTELLLHECQAQRNPKTLLFPAEQEYSKALPHN